MFLQVRIDHHTRSLSFGGDLGSSQNEELAEGPSLQSMPSDQVRSQLCNMANSLEQAMMVICPQKKTVSTY